MPGDSARSKSDRAGKIRFLNDAFRRDHSLGVVVLTQGVAALGPQAVNNLLSEVAQFDGFCAENDPYGEHDFGSLTFDGTQVFWKIDYFDQAMQMHSPNPADIALTRRVLTLLMADEY